MIAFAYYLLKVLICSAALFLYYKIALQNRAFHQWNRFYLLLITVLSLVIPCLEFSVLWERDEISQAPIQIVQAVTAADEYMDEFSGSSSGTTISAEHWIGLLYGVVSIVFVLLFIRSLLKIRKVIDGYAVQLRGKIKFIETDAPGTPFSFFSYIFWNPDIDPQSETGRQILCHEMIHVQQKHTLDKLLMQLILIFFWCNPVFWLIRRELGMIHEFIADQESVGPSGAPALATMILQVAYPGSFNQLTNPFFKSSIKRRLSMLTKNHNPRFRYFTRTMTLPVIALVGLAFTLKTKNVVTNSVTSKDPLTVIIDAGHGYEKDNQPTGAKAEDHNEDDLVLEIAKRIKDANSNKDIRIILTREDKNNVHLHDRVKIATEHKADLFISLHLALPLFPSVSKAQGSEGMEVYVPRNNPAILQKSELLGSALIEQLKPLHNTFTSLLKREKSGIYVLDKNLCPAVLIECGYMTNKKDLEFIKEGANQQAVAQAILKAIERYAAQTNNGVIQEAVSETIPYKKRHLAGWDGLRKFLEEKEPC
jgi:N-acetylmuramoyl-L-alanine amidase